MAGGGSSKGGCYSQWVGFLEEFALRGECSSGSISFARSISGVMELSSVVPRRIRSMAQIRVSLTPMNCRRPMA